MMPLTDTRIAIRLIRGSGGRDFIRLALMAGGCALAVVTFLVALAVPRAIAASAQRAADRLPVLSETKWGSLHWSETDQYVSGRNWFQVKLAGGDVHSPLPPGLSVLPSPGHSVVSPALKSLLKGDPDLAVDLGVVDSAVILDQGLTRPDELVSYTRLSRDAATESQELNVVGFGTRVPDDSGPLGPVGLEVLILVTVPAVIFLSVCARLSVASRLTRLNSLRLLGVSEWRCARIFGRELALVAVVGAFMGFTLYLAALPRLSSGVLGVSWFPSDTGLSLLLAAFLLVLITLLTLVTATASIRRMLRRSATGEGDSRWPWMVGLALFIPSTAFLADVAWRVHLTSPKVTVLPTDKHMPYTMIAGVAAISGALLFLPTLTRAVAAWLSLKSVPIGVRLGVRMAQTHHRVGSRLIAGLVATLFVSGFAASFLRSTYLDAVGDPMTSSIVVELDSLPTDQRVALRPILPDDTRAVVQAESAASGPSTAFIHVGRCPDFLLDLGIVDSGQCPRGAARLEMRGEPGALKSGSVLKLPLIDGQTQEIAVPQATLNVYSGPEIILPPDEAPWLLLAKNASLTMVTSKADRADEKLLAKILAAAPNSRAQIVVKDPAALARYEEQGAVLRACLSLAFLLCLASFAMTMVDWRWSNARPIATQHAIGMPLRVMRFSAATQMSFPVAVAAVVAVPLVALVAYVFLSFWGADQASTGSTSSVLVIMGVGAVLLTSGLGWATVKGGVCLDDLYID